MNNKIKELTETIYTEGITKAREQAGKILTEAEKKAEKIVAESEQKARTIVAQAQEESEKIDQSLRAELQAVSEQVVEITRQELKNMVSAKASEALAKQLTRDDGFLRDLMLEIARGLHTANGKGNHFDLLVPKGSETKIESLLKSKASEILASGIKIKPVAGMKEGFSVVNEGEGFKISFTQDDFQTFFTALMKPKIKEFLFSSAGNE